MFNPLFKMLFLFFIFCVPATQLVFAQADNDSLEQLRADYKALLNARVEFEEMETDCTANDDEKADYAAWIRQLSQNFAESCRRMSSRSSQPIPADIPCAEFTAAFVSPAGIDTGFETTDAEKTAAMVAQFNDSLGDFDEKLLREQDRVKARRPLSDSAASTANGGAGGESGSGAEAGSETGGYAENTATGQQSPPQGTDQTVGGAPGSSSRDGQQSSAPDDIPDGSDDDVIARQLREAAEKETDPELKKKLWEEYRRYKKG